MDRLQEIETRKLEIREEAENTEDIEKIKELDDEVDTLNEEVEEINEQIKNEDTKEKLEAGEIQAQEVSIEEQKSIGGIKMETRNTKEYINAYAEYLKSTLVEDYNMSAEARALITTDGYATGNSATVEVPDLVDGIVRTAWEREELAQYVRRIAVKGNYKVQFEVSSTDATIHQEGNGAVDEESLILGIVEIVPQNIKKWISVSDEVLSMRGEEFLNYIYDELTYKIAKKCVDTLVSKIAQLPQTLQANESGIYDTPSAAKISEAPAVDTIVKAVSKLSDEARDITIVMNKETDADFIAAQLSANYGFDVYRGYRVVYNNSLPSYTTATATGAVYAIVGDFNHGALFNFPDGDGIKLKYDDLSKMEYDLVKILGKEYVGIGVVADKAFTLIAAPASR